MRSGNTNFYCVGLCIVGLLAGCTAPGHKMFIPSDVADVEITSITSALLAEQAAEKEHIPAGLAALAPEKIWGPYQYRIGPGDILNITVWDHPELTIPAGEYRSAEQAGHLVAADGTIFYPYAGTVEVAGKTTRGVREILTSRISRTIRNPQLDVRVASFRSQRAYVVGEVDQPGPTPITDKSLTIVDAISQAGRTTGAADLAHATLTRDEKTYDVDLVAIYRHGDLAGNMLLQDGDVLRIPNKNLRQVFVLGEVVRPGPMGMRDGRLTLAEALTSSGGVSATTSDPAGIYVLRGAPEKPDIYQLGGKSPTGLLLAEQFELAPHDVVYVESAGVTRWSRVIDQILPSAGFVQGSANTGAQF